MLFGTAGVAAEGSSGVLRGHQYAACGLIATLGLAGCTGGGDDPPPSSTTASGGPTTSSPSSGSTTTASSPPTATVAIPPAARAHTEAGAEAFVKFFMDEVSSSWTKPEAGLISPLGEPNCLACKSFEDTAKDLVSKSQRYESRPSTTVSADAADGGPRQIVHLVLQQHEVNVVDSKGNTVLTDKKKRFAVNAELIWREERWWLYDMG